MPSEIISIESLGKRYAIRHQDARGHAVGYQRLSEELVTLARAPFRALAARLGRPFRGVPSAEARTTEEFWALRDVSFTVQEGAVLGIIGRNGAGKSTLLKILSRITEPTEGRVTIAGRVASLLEVGTGFHPELSGRENVHLNGAILGMTRAEIRRKFDEIVGFADVERFLDTPVKQYSSGMYVRLAFAVAAHLEPEILIVDEVLAVGDAEFQRKCLGKMGDVARDGRTVIFVSHNMDAVTALCTTAIVLEGGRNTEAMKPADAVARYLAGCLEMGSVPLRDRPRDQALTQAPILTSIRIKTEGGQDGVVPAGGGVEFDLELNNFRKFPGLQVGLILSNMLGQRVAVFQSLVNSNLVLPGADHARVRCSVSSLPMVPDTYRVDLALWDGYQVVERVEQAATLTVVFRDLFGTGRLPVRGHGYFALPARWTVE